MNAIEPHLVFGTTADKTTIALRVANSSATATADIIEVSIRNGAWQRAGRLPRAMSDAAAAVVGSVAWLVGGETSGPSAPVSSVLAVRVARG